MSKPQGNPKGETPNRPQLPALAGTTDTYGNHQRVVPHREDSVL
jgi:hypothetical protein